MRNSVPRRRPIHGAFGLRWALVETEGLGRIVGLSLEVSRLPPRWRPCSAWRWAPRLPSTPYLAGTFVVALNALLGLPPVVVGLTLYLLLSRSGPLGGLGILFTPAAMVLAQSILALPIVAALSHRAMEGSGGTTAMTCWCPAQPACGPSPPAVDRAPRLVTAVLAGFGRTISEVGAILIVGGNIAGYTRTMTTAIVLETSEGNLSFALGLGLVLIALAWRSARRYSALEPAGGAHLEIMKCVACWSAWRCPGAAVARLAEPDTPPSAVDRAGLDDIGRQFRACSAHILPIFTKETGIAVHVLAQGTGQALATAAHGDADLVLVHDPEAEQKFIAAGHGVNRRQIAWNDFIIVGPRADPAHIAGGNDAVAALKAIAAAKAPFVSRGDKSGTDALEQRAVERRRDRPGQSRRRRMVSRYRRRHGRGAEHRRGDGRLHVPTAAPGSASATRAISARAGRRRSEIAEPLRRHPARSEEASGGEAGARAHVSPLGWSRPKARPRSAPTGCGAAAVPSLGERAKITRLSRLSTREIQSGRNWRSSGGRAEVERDAANANKSASCARVRARAWAYRVAEEWARGAADFSDMALPARPADIRAVRIPVVAQHRVRSAKLENAMSTRQMQPRTATQSPYRPSAIARAAQLGRGVAMAGALAAVSLAAIPTTARADGAGTGVAIGLGVLGGVLAGAAIAATAPPVYAAPPSYYYPQQGYYYNPAPNYYYPPQPYYGSAAYSYPSYNYQ